MLLVQTNVSSLLQSIQGPLTVIALQLCGRMGEQNAWHSYFISPGSHNEMAGT